jgi:2-oxoglutarate ferredoxin oxidoreductase subunit alpha
MIGQMMEPVALPEAKEPVMGDAIREAKPWALTGHRFERERHALNSVWLQHELLEEYMDQYWPKYERAEKELQDWEEYLLEDAEVVYVSYGSTSRIAREAIDTLRAEGIKVGMIRPKTLWPFPAKAFEKLGDNVKHVISVELSKGQLIRDVRLAVEGKYPVSLINRYGGVLLDSEEVVERTKKILEVK